MRIHARKTLNRTLLLKVAARLKRLRHQAHYNQSTFIETNACGTACCIAGWALLESGMKPKEVEQIREDFPGGVGQAAVDVLGLPTSSRYPTLFHEFPSISWPEPYATRWANSTEKGPNRQSKIAADLLEAIAKGKVKITKDGG